MRKFSGILTALSLAAMTAGLASANSLTVTCPTITGPTDFGAMGQMGTSTIGTVSCPGDASLGILASQITAISLTIDGGLAATINITNNNTQSETGTATSMSPFSLITALPGTGLSIPFTLFNVSAMTSPITLAGGAASGSLSASGSGTVTETVSSGSFAFYESAFSFTGQTNDLLSVTFTGGNVSATQMTDASLGATVTYTFTPSSVPEPATMALMGSALIALGLLGKRINAKRNQLFRVAPVSSEPDFDHQRDVQI